MFHNSAIYHNYFLIIRVKKIDYYIFCESKANESTGKCLLIVVDPFKDLRGYQLSCNSGYSP